MTTIFSRATMYILDSQSRIFFQCCTYDFYSIPVEAKQDQKPKFRLKWYAWSVYIANILQISISIIYYEVAYNVINK